MKSIKYLICLSLILPATASAWQWMDLWRTPDQQGMKLLQTGKATAAAQVFKNKNWQSVAYYRAGNYAQAFKQFSNYKTSDAQYNAGNAAAYMDKYQEAIAAYDKAIALNANNHDAITNREIIKKLLQQQQQSQQNKPSANNNKNDQKPPQPNSSQNSTQQNQTGKPKQQQDAQKDSSANSRPQLANNSPQNQSGNAQQNANAKPITGQQQRQDENNKQLLRRLSDDTDGLLQQKFLRDYAHRHDLEVNSDLGDN